MRHSVHRILPVLQRSCCQSKVNQPIAAIMAPRSSCGSGGSRKGGGPGKGSPPGGGGPPDGSPGGGGPGDGSDGGHEPLRRYPLDPLYLDWDNDKDVRDRLRAGGHLLVHWDPASKKTQNCFVEKTVENLRVNACVLRPLFKYMAQYDRALPILDTLMEQITKLFERSKIRFTLHSERVYQEAWACRRLASLAKAQVYRHAAPKDLGLKIDRSYI